MKFHSLILLSLLLLATSCRKEEIIEDDPIVITDPPEEIDGTLFKGIVTDNDNAAVSDAIIKVYQEGELIGETMTDASGSYSTSEIPIAKGPEVTFSIEEEAFVGKYKRIASEGGQNENNDLRIVRKTGQQLGEDNVLENPGNPELIKVYGTLTDVNGDPLTDVDCIIAWEFEKISDDRLRFEGLYDLTDENGYIEFLAEPGIQLYFFAAQFNGSAPCSGYVSQEDENILDWGLYFDDLGVNDSDFEVYEQEGLLFEQTEYLFYGDFKNCDNTPVTGGEAVLKIKYFDQDSITRTFRTDEFDSDGEYRFEFGLCGYDGPIDIELSLINQDTMGTSLSVPNVRAPGIHFVPLLACDDLRPKVVCSYMDIAIGDDYNFNRIKFEHEPLTFPYSFGAGATHEDVAGFITMGITEIELGENVIDRFDFGWFGDDPFQFNSFGTLIYDVSSIDNNQIKGSITGEVQTRDLGTQEIEAKFTINIE